MLRLHHLGVSQSERIVWLLEELEIPFELVKHTRDPALAPQSLKDVPGNIPGRSPFLEDLDAGVTVGESNAIVEYVVWKYAGGRLTIKPDDNRFADYLFWCDTLDNSCPKQTIGLDLAEIHVRYHYANSSMQPAMLVCMFLNNAQLSAEAMSMQHADKRLHASLSQMNDRLKDNKWLAGDEFTAADIVSVYPLTTQRYFGPQVSLRSYNNILRWLKDCSSRPAFQKAMEKGDPEMHVLIDAEPPKISLLADGGVKSNLWKKK